MVAVVPWLLQVPTSERYQPVGIIGNGVIPRVRRRKHDPPCLVLEHLEKLFLRRQMGQDALDAHEALKAADAFVLGEQDLGHAARGQPPQDFIVAETLAHKMSSEAISRVPCGSNANVALRVEPALLRQNISQLTCHLALVHGGVDHLDGAERL